MSDPLKRSRFVIVPIVVLMASASAWLVPAAAAGKVSIDASIDGRPLKSATSRHPATLRPDRPADLRLTVTNGSESPLTVRTVRLSGRVMGLTFYRLDTSVDFTVASGATESREFPLDMSGLTDEAIGLLPSSLSVLGPGHRHIASERTLVDVRGSWHSVYGLFGIVIAIATALLFVRTLTQVARHSLAVNRMIRAVSFLPLGVGLGLTLTFITSAERLLVPDSATWVSMFAMSCLLAFAAGYASPTPEVDDPSRHEPGSPLDESSGDATPVQNGQAVTAAWTSQATR